MPAPTPTQAPKPLPPSKPENEQFAHYLAESLVPIRKDAYSYLAATQSGDEYGRMCYGMAMTAFGLIELCVSIDLAKNNTPAKQVYISDIAPFVAKQLNHLSPNQGTPKGDQEIDDLKKVINALWLTQRHKIAHTSTAHYGKLENTKVQGPILEAKNGSFIFNTLPFLNLAMHIAEWQKAEILRVAWPGAPFHYWRELQEVPQKDHMPLDLLSDPTMLEKLSAP